MISYYFSRRELLKGFLLVAFSPLTIMANPSKTLIIFFSHTGHTKKLAHLIHSQVGGDLVELKTVEPYTLDHEELVKLAKIEQKQHKRPKLATKIPDLTQYHTIFLGYPNWWGTMPMALFTLLENYDFSLKTIIPFCTHGGSRFGDSVKDIKRLCPKSKVLKGFAAFGRKVDGVADEVEAWLKGLKI